MTLNKSRDMQMWVSAFSAVEVFNFLCLNLPAIEFYDAILMSKRIIIIQVIIEADETAWICEGDKERILWILKEKKS